MVDLILNSEVLFVKVPKQFALVSLIKKFFVCIQILKYGMLNFLINLYGVQIIYCELSI